MTLRHPGHAVPRLPALLHPRHRHHRRREVTDAVPGRADLRHRTPGSAAPRRGRRTGCSRPWRPQRIRATFFLQGRWAEAYPDVARSIAAAGHLVGQPLPLPRPDAAAHRRRARRRTSRTPRPRPSRPPRARPAALVPLPVRRRARSTRGSRPPSTAAGYRHVGWHVGAEDWEPGRTADESSRPIVVAGALGAWRRGRGADPRLAVADRSMRCPR